MKNMTADDCKEDIKTKNTCKYEQTSILPQNQVRKYTQINEKSTYKNIEAEKLKQALYSRALGYETQEIIEEFCADGRELALLKKKVTTKEVLPDISAAKLLLEIVGSKSEYEKMTDSELEAEKVRLLALIETMNIEK